MVNPEKNIIILSCGVGAESLPANFAEIVKNATTLVGGSRLLELFPDYTGTKITVDRHIRKHLAKLAETEETVVILASGDALFHGIAKTVLEIIPEKQVKIVPNVTAAQALCAKIALPWDNASFFSVHGKDPESINWTTTITKLPVIIYGDNKCNAANIAKKLLQTNPGAADYSAAVGINLGMDDEIVLTGTLEEISKAPCSGLSVLAIFAPDAARNADKESKNSRVIFGRGDSEFAHHNSMITHSEVRAIALSKLNLIPGTMWDIGAGSGSVGIEAALLQPELMVYAIEKNAERVDDIKTNIKKFKRDNVKVICRDALSQIPNLPNPDTVFVGGGGDDISEIITQSYLHLKPGGTIVATAVLLETRTSLSETLKEACSEVLSISVSRSKQLGKSRIMKAENNIEIYVYKKRSNS